MADQLNSVIKQVVQRTSSNTGKLRTEAERASFALNVRADLASVLEQLNAVYYPLASELLSEQGLNALDFGLSGNVIKTNITADIASATAYWDPSKSRPRSVKETIDVVLSEIARLDNLISGATSTSEIVVDDALQAHIDAADPHPQYTTEAEVEAIIGDYVTEDDLHDAFQTLKENDDWQQSVISVELTAPPGSPSDGDRYLISGILGAATGLWAGHDEQIAEWHAGSGVWRFTSPTVGMTVMAETGAQANRLAWYTGGNWPAGSWGLLPLEYTGNKGVGNGYASLDSNVLVAQYIRKITSTAAAADGDISIGAGGLQWRWASTPQTAQAMSGKGQPNGYAGLNGSSLVTNGVIQIAMGAPGTTTGRIGMNGTLLQFGDGSVQRTVEQTGNKDINSGYAGLDGSGRVNAQVKLVASVAPSTATGSIGMNGTDLSFGNGTNARIVEITARKDVANGYAGLNGSSQVTAAVIQVQTASPGTSSGRIGVNGGNLLFGEGINERTVEITARKNTNDGYAGVDSSGYVTPSIRNVAQIAPVADAQIGIDAGLFKARIGGVDKVVVTADQAGLPSGFTSIRKISSGTAFSVPAAGSTDVVVISRIPAECLQVFFWLRDDVASIPFAEDRLGVLGGLTAGIGLHFERTTNADEFKLVATNSHATDNRSIDWCIMGVAP